MVGLGRLVEYPVEVDGVGPVEYPVEVEGHRAWGVVRVGDKGDGAALRTCIRLWLRNRVGVVGAGICLGE